MRNLRASLGEMWTEEFDNIGHFEDAIAKTASTKDPGDVPAGRKGMYFRPVSVTLQCVMVLTIASLAVYTMLSLSRTLR